MTNRYSRQVIFPGIGEAGQRKLAASYVVIAGCGALGTVRLSPGYFSTLEEMDSAVRAIGEIAKAGRLNIESE